MTTCLRFWRLLKTCGLTRVEVNLPAVLKRALGDAHDQPVLLHVGIGEAVALAQVLLGEAKEGIVEERFARECVISGGVPAAAVHHTGLVEHPAPLGVLAERGVA